MCLFALHVAIQIDRGSVSKLWVISVSNTDNTQLISKLIFLHKVFNSSLFWVVSFSIKIALKHHGYFTLCGEVHTIIYYYSSWDTLSILPLVVNIFTSKLCRYYIFIFYGGHIPIKTLQIFCLLQWSYSHLKLCK